MGNNGMVSTMSGGNKKCIASVTLSVEDLDKMDHATLVGLVQRLREQNWQLSELLQSYVKDKYGRRTERFENPDQLRLFNSPDTPADSEPSQPAESSTEQSRNNKRKKPGHGRNPYPSNLNRVRVPAPTPSPEELTCPCCYGTKVKEREIIRNTRYEYKPAELFIEEIIEDIYVCPNCTDQAPTTVKTAECIPNGTAGPQLLSHIIGALYCLHLPLHRQEQEFSRLGANIPRSTMCGWLAATAKLLRPIYNLAKSLLLQSKVICTDDTPVKVQDRKRKTNIKTGRIWVYIGDKAHPFNLFDYTQGRGRAGPVEFLAGFKGYLQGDCFSGNEAVCAQNGAILCACNAHARRYFTKALPNNKASAEHALTVYQQLYKVESDAREFGLSPADLKRIRQEESLDIFIGFRDWLNQQTLCAVPKSTLGKAVSYTLNNWEALTRYLQDGDIGIDNNMSEREMKTVATGRKNWYFFGSDAGGERAEVLMSLVSTCKRHGVDPYEYLRDVIVRLTKDPGCNLHELLPNCWSSKVDSVSPAAIAVR